MGIHDSYILRIEREIQYEAHVHIVRTVIMVTASLFLAVQARAVIHSRTNEPIVVQPKDFPEQVQMPGNSFFLYSDSVGFTYLYVEQQHVAQLTVFDVTNTSKIKFVAPGPVNGPGAFDFVRLLDGHGELVDFVTIKRLPYSICTK
jgi:hypothetical protein